MDQIRIELSWAEAQRATLKSLVHNGTAIETPIVKDTLRGMTIEYTAESFASHKLRAVLDFTGLILHDLKCDVIVNGVSKRVDKTKERAHFWRIVGRWE